MTTTFSPGSLVRARGREWIVLTGSTAETIKVRPLSGSEEDTTWLHLGIEYWMRAEIDEFAHHYLGPTISIQFKRLWWTVAPYLRLDDLGVATAPNDKFGRFWVRSVLGLNL